MFAESRLNVENTSPDSRLKDKEKNIFFVCITETLSDSKPS